MTVGIIGCGNLGLSILNGLHRNNPDIEIIGSKRSIDSLVHLSNKKISFTTDNVQLIVKSDIVICALKPFMLIDFLKEYEQNFNVKQHTLISVATGISTQEITTALGNRTFSLFRAMPNTAAAVQESMTAVCMSSDPLKSKTKVNQLLESIGKVCWIEEQLMESATILGACGIAYVLRFMRAMTQGGIEVGFDAETANLIVSQTVKGAAQLLIQNESHPEQEIDKVTTPKGCTIVGLNTMEHSGFSSSLIKGIVSSYEKIERH
jgi:pyrroline-5-carboxylate reductase